MTAFTALSQMTDIDPVFIADADTLPTARRFPVRAVVAVAACFAVLCTAVGLFALYKKPEPPLITEYSAYLIGSYASPRAGEVLVFTEISQTMEEYKEKEVLFWVSVDVHSKNSADGCINFNEAEIDAECERLASLGHELYVHKKNWIGYWGEEKHYTTVHLKLTADEIRQFESTSIRKEYGYAFHPSEYAPEECYRFKIG